MWHYQQSNRYRPLPVVFMLNKNYCSNYLKLPIVFMWNKNYGKFQKFEQSKLSWQQAGWIKPLSPVFCCCPSQLQWCFRWRPQPHQWEHWTARCLPRESRIWTRTLHLHCTPGTGSQRKHSVNNVAAHVDPNHTENGRTVYPCEGILHSRISRASLTFTEWLWKSVTIISFLLFTATKCGPGRGQRGRLLRKRKRVPVSLHRFPSLLVDRLNTNYNKWCLKLRLKPCSNQTVSSSVLPVVLWRHSIHALDALTWAFFRMSKTLLKSPTAYLAVPDVDG